MHAHAAQLAAASLQGANQGGVPLSHTDVIRYPIAYALSNPMVAQAQAAAGLGHHIQAQFQYMYSDGSEEEVDSEG